MTRFQAFLGVARAPFLILTPLCVLLGFAAAYALPAQGEPLHFNALNLILTLIGATAAHVAVNALNEWSDYRSGLDKLTQRTPFSGGSGTLVAQPELLGFALQVGLGALAVTVLCGLYLASVSGPALWGLGIVGVLIVILYTDYINKRAWLCLIAPGTGFGLLMTLGSYYVASQQLTWEALAVSLPVFLLANNLLFLNQFPDTEADRQIGRHNIPIAMGKPRAAQIYAMTLVAVYGIMLFALMATDLPWGYALGLLPALAVLPLIRGVQRNAENIPALQAFMGMNVAVTLLTPGLSALGLFVQPWFFPLN